MVEVKAHLDELIDARIELRKSGKETPDDTLEAMLNDQQVAP